MNISLGSDGSFGLIPSSGVEFTSRFYQRLAKDFGKTNQSLSVKSTSLNTPYASISGGITHYESPGWYKGVFSTSSYDRNTAPTQTKTRTELTFFKSPRKKSILRGSIATEYEGSLSFAGESVQKQKQALKVVSETGELSGDIDKITFKYPSGFLVDGSGSATNTVIFEGSQDLTNTFRPYKEWISASTLGRNGILGMGRKGFDYLTAGDDTIDGTDFNDKIETGAGNDQLVGNGGADRLTGGLGKDIFIYRNPSDSGVGKKERDIITDFNGAIGDRIDLRQLDEDDSGISFSKKEFKYIGDQAFVEGAEDIQIRFAKGTLQIDQTMDGKVDMEIKLLRVKTFGEDFLVL